MPICPPPPYDSRLQGPTLGKAVRPVSQQSGLVLLHYYHCHSWLPQEKQKGVVVYELESLTSSTSHTPDWGFKAAAAIAANGSSYVLHLQLPFGHGPASKAGAASEAFKSRSASSASSASSATGNASRSHSSLGGGSSSLQHALAVAEYGSGHWVLYTLDYTANWGLVVTELQRTGLRGVAALALCSTSGDGSGAVGEAGEEIFLVGLSYFDKGFTTRSAVYRCGEHVFCLVLM